MELLKKFQSCRAFLGNILQKAEQTISEQASYMSKDNLQRLVARVGQHLLCRDTAKYSYNKEAELFMSMFLKCL